MIEAMEAKTMIDPIVLGINDLCNLNCWFCRIESATGKAVSNGKKEFDFCVALAEKAQRENVIIEDIRLLSSEPTLLPPTALGLCIKVLRTVTPYVDIVTNGYALSQRDYFDKLEKIIKPIGSVGITVSIDGARDVHNASRGEGTYERAVIALDRVVASKWMKPELNIVLTLDLVNYKEEVIELINKYSAQGVPFNMRIVDQYVAPSLEDRKTLAKLNRDILSNVMGKETFKSFKNTHNSMCSNNNCQAKFIHNSGTVHSCTDFKESNMMFASFNDATFIEMQQGSECAVAANLASIPEECVICQHHHSCYTEVCRNYKDKDGYSLKCVVKDRR